MMRVVKDPVKDNQEKKVYVAFKNEGACKAFLARAEAKAKFILKICAAPGRQNGNLYGRKGK